MKIKHVLLGAVLFAGIALFGSTKITHASEGVVELRSTTRESYRCFAYYQLLPDQNQTVLVSCRDLIYPTGSSIIYYILWMQPTDGSAPRRLGELGYGSLSARTPIPFNQLFVTSEQVQNTNKPGGPVAMRGNVSAVPFLDRGTTGTPTPVISSGTTGTPEPGVSVSPTPGESTGSKIATAFKRAGLAALLALLALIGLVFAITRSKG
jgi:hypothetical protein